MDDSPAKNDEDKRNELLQKERRSKKDARSFCPLFFLFFLSFFFARHPSTFPGAPRSHQISVVPGRATSLFLRTFAIVGDSFRQVETLLHHPLAASLSSSFFSVFFFSPLGRLLSSISQPDVAPPRATESFTNFRCDNARCKDKKALSESGSRPSE